MIGRKDLRYFLAVVEAGNFSRAARQVNVTQPALSVAVAKLETALGAKLFERNSQRVHLTDAGARLLDHARSIDREFRAIEGADLASAARQVARLGVLNTIPTAVVEAVAARNRQASAPTPLEIVEGSERDLIARLHRGRIDFALTILRPRPGGFTQEPLYREGYSLALPAWHPLAKESAIPATDLATEVMIVRRHCEVLAETSRHFTAHGVRPRFSLRTTNDDRVMSMVRAGLGITVMPDGFQDAGIARPRLEGFDHEREIGVLILEQRSADRHWFAPLHAALRDATARA